MSVCTNVTLFARRAQGKTQPKSSDFLVDYPSHLVEVAYSHRGKVDLIEGSGGVTNCDCWPLLKKLCFSLKKLDT